VPFAVAAKILVIFLGGVVGKICPELYRFVAVIGASIKTLLQVLFYAKSLEAKLPDPDCIIQITERINILKSEVTQC